MLNALLDRLNRTSLVLQIVMALVLGGLVAWLAPAAAQPASLLGTLFISALKAVAPILVFLLVIAAISNHRPGQETQIKPVIWLYLIGTLAAACVGVAASMLFPSVIHFREAPASQGVPGAISTVLMNVLKSAFDNPVNALLQANYIGILAWPLRWVLRCATPMKSRAPCWMIWARASPSSFRALFDWHLSASSVWSLPPSLKAVWMPSRTMRTC